MTGAQQLLLAMLTGLAGWLVVVAAWRTLRARGRRGDGGSGVREPSVQPRPILTPPASDANFVGPHDAVGGGPAASTGGPASAAAGGPAGTVIGEPPDVPVEAHRRTSRDRDHASNAARFRHRGRADGGQPRDYSTSTLRARARASGASRYPAA